MDGGQTGTRRAEAPTYSAQILGVLMFSRTQVLNRASKNTTSHWWLLGYLVKVVIAQCLNMYDIKEAVPSTGEGSFRTEPRTSLVGNRDIRVLQI